MTNKKLREEFRKLVILGCHPECDTYEEAVKKEGPLSIEELDEDGNCWIKVGCFGYPITLSRVMMALNYRFNKVGFNHETCAYNGGDIEVWVESEGDFEIEWKLAKKNGETCTDIDQSDETIEHLVYVLKKRS